MNSTAFSGHYVQRYWCLRGEVERYDGSGFFVAPQKDTTSSTPETSRSPVQTLLQLNDFHCLILLGEPGMGKTVAIAEAIEAEKQDEDHHLHIDLNRYSQEETLLRHIFEDVKFQMWRQGNCNLHIWLDSLDECLISIDTIGSLLGDEFLRNTEGGDVSRLWLRITCRPAVWTGSLESALRKTFGNEKTAVVQLCPLQRQDVQTLANAVGVEPQSFLDEITKHNAIVLATRPITLEFLLNSFKEGTMPTTRDELFRLGCLRHCTELNLHRRERRRTGKLTSLRRLEIASYIAAISIFSGCPFLYRDFQSDAPPGSLILPEILIGDGEIIPIGIISIFDIDEVLDTPLFTTMEVDGRVLSTFSHHTFAEFLAAYYLHLKQISKTKFLSLLSHSDKIGHSTALAPQLIETALWMALYDLKNNQRNGAFRYMVEKHPAALLRADVALAPNEEKLTLVQALLEEIQAGRLIDDVWNRSNYHYLDSVGLAERLEPFVIDRAKNIMVRRAAIGIAEQCPHAFSLANVLAEISLDETEDILIRIQAAYAVMKIGQANNDSALLLRLRPLATEQSANDTEDELKGVALSALWPSLITTEELFSMLTPPKSKLYGDYCALWRSFITAGGLFSTWKPKNELYGAYRGLLYRIPDLLQPSDLVVALRWCQLQEERIDYNSELWDIRELLEGIIDMACENIEIPAVPEALANALVIRLQHDDLDEIWSKQNPPAEHIKPLSDKQRHAVVSLLIKLLTNESDRLIRVTLLSPRGMRSARGQRSPWLLYEDLDWLIDQFCNHSNEAQQRVGAFLIVQLCDYDSLHHQLKNGEKLFELKQTSPVLSEAIAERFGPIQLDSEEAKTLREDHVLGSRLKNEREEAKAKAEVEHQEAESRRHQAIEKFLTESETGTVESWRLFDLYTNQDPEITDFTSHLNKTEFWKNADAVLRKKVLKSADSYLRKFQPQQILFDEWEKGIFDRRALAAHRALLLLYLENRAAFDSLPPSQIQIWAKATVWFPWPGGEPWEKDNHLLLQSLYERAPREVADAVIARIECVNNHSDHIFELRKLQFHWDAEFCEALLSKAADVTLKPFLVYSILKELLEQEALPVVVDWIEHPNKIGDFKFGPIRHQAEVLLRESLAPEDRNEQRAKPIALALLENTPDCGGLIVWGLIQNHPAWGQDVMLAFAERDHHPAITNGLKWLPENTLAEWSIWLEEVFPRDEDPHVRGVHAITPREEVGYFRDRLPNILQSRANPQAVRALERIAQSKPDHWANYLLPEARQLALANTWQPPQPYEIIELLGSENKRFVRNGEELLDVLIESLQRFNEKLQDETPAAPDLWNTLPSGLSRPKDEQALSDRLKRHLEDDLIARAIIVNREVEIRRGEGKGKGERTDILVKAVMPEKEWATITAVIEVKGSWNPDLKTAMEKQLRDRYLKENSCECGLYVVGWFNCPQWDEADGRQKKTPKKTVAEAQQLFDGQADTLSCSNARLRAIVLDAKLR